MNEMSFESGSGEMEASDAHNLSLQAIVDANQRAVKRQLVNLANASAILLSAVQGYHNGGALETAKAMMQAELEQTKKVLGEI